MSGFVSPFAELPVLNQVVVPDLWQQQAVSALRDSQDVVVPGADGLRQNAHFRTLVKPGQKPRSGYLYRSNPCPRQ